MPALKNKGKQLLNIIIIGAGGFGREVFNWARASFDPGKYMIKGFLSISASDLDGFDMEVGILGSEDNYLVEVNDRFIFAIGDISKKKLIIDKMKGQGAQFLTMIHPSAIVADTATIGEGVVICPFATVSDRCLVNDFTMMNFYSSCGHDSQIGKYCILSPYATVNGFSILDDEVFMGTHSTVTERKKIGCQTRISANSVAMYDVPPRSFVYGVPGKIATIYL